MSSPLREGMPFSFFVYFAAIEYAVSLRSPD
jgi:hypothetical protein